MLKANFSAGENIFQKGFYICIFLDGKAVITFIKGTCSCLLPARPVAREGVEEGEISSGRGKFFLGARYVKMY